jgi:hypothetical protein
MKAHQSLVAIAYCHAASTIDFSEGQWDLLIRQARAANMLARLCARFEQKQLLDKIPRQVKFHFTSARVSAQALERSICWEVHCLCKALAKSDIPLVLLKGAAYTYAHLPASLGRSYEDVDILVPKDELPTVERKLMLHGWVTTHTDSYDQRYYRQWMHELPPMRHVKRQSSLDVHHSILPETARLHPDPKKLFARAKLIDDNQLLFILSAPDMVLHSATHLFSDGELHNGLRDLTDLDLLLQEFSKKETFWLDLLDRAEEMELARPLYYALRYTSRILGTPIPKAIVAKSEDYRPHRFKLLLMDFLFAHGLQPDHPTCRRSLTGVARWMLYIRSHYLRMPLHLLIPHLIRKAVKKDKQ